MSRHFRRIQSRGCRIVTAHGSFTVTAHSTSKQRHAAQSRLSTSYTPLLNSTMTSKASAKGRRRSRRRRRTITSPVFLTSAFLIWWFMSPVKQPSRLFSRRRLSQLLRGAVTESSPAINNQSVSLQSNDTTIPTVPLHATTGTHHVYVYIGSPPQRQTLIVDTGSRLLAFPCQPCRGCGRHASQFYSHKTSTTDVIPKCDNCYLNVSKCSEFSDRCVVTQKYTEGSSWTAFETEDVVMVRISLGMA